MNHILCRSMIAVVVLPLASSYGAAPGPFTFQRTISVSGTTQFGVDLANFNGNLLVGATYGDIFQAQSGKAFLMDPNTGSVIRQFNNPATHSGDFYGRSIAQFGDNVAVGAPGGQSDPGGDVYIFNGQTGSLVRSISNAAGNDRFGWSMSAANGRLYVGTPELRTGTQYNGPGRVQVYPAIGTGPTINNPMPGSNPAFDEESFGYDVAASGNTAFVGALYDDGGGKVWQVNGETGAVVRMYTNPDGTLGNGGRPQFGVSVDVLGDYLLVGANQSSASGVDASGAAYLFNATTGELIRRIFDPQPGVLDNFGIAVALVDQFAVVGAHNDGNGKGAVFVYDLATGALVQTLQSPFASSNFYGLELSRVGSQMLAVSEATTAGRVHIYAIPEPNGESFILVSGAMFIAHLPRRRLYNKWPGL